MKTYRLCLSQIQKAVSLMRSGQIVAFPTETVYGLGAPLFCKKTISKIFEAKKRPQDNPLIAHVGSLLWAQKISRDLPPAFFTLAENFFPGPLTLIVAKSDKVPDIVSKGLDTIAIRQPSHPIAQKLLLALDEPIVAPSANLSGRPSGTCAGDVLDDFDGLIGGVIDGGFSPMGIESTVIDLYHFEKPTLLRYGGVDKQAIEEVLGYEIKVYTQGPKSSPGMSYCHYAPNLPVLVVENLDEDKGVFASSYVLSHLPLSIQHHLLERKTFYHHLRRAEKENVDQVVIVTKGLRDPVLLHRIEKIQGSQ